MDTKGILCEDAEWVHLAQDKVRLHALVDTVINGPSGLMKGKEFQDQLSDYYFAKNDPAP
jgi:hypothetical protein